MESQECLKSYGYKKSHITNAYMYAVIGGIGLIAMLIIDVRFVPISIVAIIVGLINGSAKSKHNIVKIFEDYFQIQSAPKAPVNEVKFEDVVKFEKLRFSFEIYTGTDQSQDSEKKFSFPSIALSNEDLDEFSALLKTKKKKLCQDQQPQ